MKGLGSKIKTLRKTRRLTLVEVSKATGLDQATLSRIENDKMTGTLDSHRRIAEALGIRVTELYDSVMREIESTKDKKVEAKLETFSHTGGAVAQLLTSGVLQKKMMPVLLKIKGRGRTETEELPISSERFIYVLKGSLQAVIGSEKKNLRQNESLYFTASTPHHFENPNKSECTLISVITPVSL